MIKFPYVYIGEKRYPIIPLIVKKEKTIYTNALVDSGASISIFDKSIANSLKINIKSGKRIPLQGIGGKISAYVHNICLLINNIDMRIPIAFCEKIELNFNILGRQGFFKKFLITFDEKNKITILKPHK